MMRRRFQYVLLSACLCAVPAVAAAQTNISLAWDANPEPGVIGYRVYVGTSAAVYTQTIDVGNVTAYRFQTGTVGQRYYFAVSAYEAGPLEGIRSSEVSGIFPGVTTGESTGGGSAGGGSTGGGSTGGTTTGGSTTGGSTAGGSSSGGSSSGGSSSGGSSSGGSTSGGGGGAGGSAAGGGASSGGGGGSTGGGGGTTAPPSSTAGVSAGPEPPTGPAVVMQPAVVSGRTVTLSWTPVGGLVAAEYVLEAGSAAGVSNLYNASVGATTSLSANVGLGTYFVRVRGRSAQGTTTAPSNEVSFTIGGAGSTGCSAPPAAPLGVFGSVVNGVASVGWIASAGADAYLVQAGSAPGLSNIYYGNVGAATLVSAPVLSGFQAFVRVVALNACGQSAASSEVFIQ